jgi:hypothetical protein
MKMYRGMLPIQKGSPMDLKKKPNSTLKKNEFWAIKNLNTSEFNKTFYMSKREAKLDACSFEKVVKTRIIEVKNG